MGLDMTLYRTTIQCDKFNYKNAKEVGYWRKANAVHNWFVQNCQGGVDDCRCSVVGKDKLEELLMTCKKVMNITSSPRDLLPTTSGYFFGSTAYDEGYFYDIENTINILEKILAETDFTKFSIYYSSSW